MKGRKKRSAYGNMNELNISYISTQIVCGTSKAHTACIRVHVDHLLFLWVWVGISRVFLGPMCCQPSTSRNSICIRTFVCYRSFGLKGEKSYQFFCSSVRSFLLLLFPLTYNVPVKCDSLYKPMRMVDYVICA